MRATACCAFGGEYFGEHTAAAYSASCAARHGFQLCITSLGQANQRSVFVFARIGGVQASLVGEDDQHVRLDQIGYKCAQGVVVAEFNFIGNDGIVFIDDGDDAQGQ